MSDAVLIATLLLIFFAPALAATVYGILNLIDKRHPERRHFGRELILLPVLCFPSIWVHFQVRDAELFKGLGIYFLIYQVVFGLWAWTWQSTYGRRVAGLVLGALMGPVIFVAWYCIAGVFINGIVRAWRA